MVILAVCFFGKFAFAQSEDEMVIPEGVQVSPARFDWDLKSGDERTGIINLKNFSKDRSFEIDVEVEDFYISDDSTEARFFIPDQGHPLYGYDVINWIEIPEKKITLAPEEAKDVKFIARVPQDQPTGGYYGAIFFKSKVQKISEISGQDSQLIVNQRVGALLVMAVKGKEPIKLSGLLESFASIKKIFFEKPAEFIAQVKNTGNLHFKALGKFEITKFGKSVVSVDLPQRVLYPGKTRQYEEKWDFSSWSYGFYKAKISFVSEDGEIKFDSETSFWVIPWKTTASIIILLVIVYFILKIFSTKFEIKRKSSREKDNKKKDEDDQNIEDDKTDDISGKN